jgi:hypothetical protein
MTYLKDFLKNDSVGINTSEIYQERKFSRLLEIVCSYLELNSINILLLVSGTLQFFMIGKNTGYFNVKRYSPFSFWNYILVDKKNETKN